MEEQKPEEDGGGWCAVLTEGWRFI